jgi:hypothetical protein
LLLCQAVRQNQKANSSCVAEINATHECINDLLSVKHRAIDLGFPEASERITVYNDNKAACDWASSVTLKGTKHINLHENCVRQNHQNGTVLVKHIPGVINAGNLFSKEIKDDAHFRRCRDTFMVSRSNFMKFGHCVSAHLTSKALLPYYSLHSKVSPETFAESLTRSPKLTASAARTVSNRPSTVRSERGCCCQSNFNLQFAVGGCIPKI